MFPRTPWNTNASVSIVAFATNSHLVGHEGRRMMFVTRKSNVLQKKCVNTGTTKDQSPGRQVLVNQLSDMSKYLKVDARAA
jgi:hypothetical protein